jgi:hypothetical protein
VDPLSCHSRTKSMVSGLMVTGARKARASGPRVAMPLAHSGRLHT